jgi:hypothetical protein
MLAARRRSAPLLLALLALLLLICYRSQDVYADRIYAQWTAPSTTQSPGDTPANRTLGFGAVLAVSKPASKRRHALVQAANVTDFDITIPHQPTWTEGDVQRFINGQPHPQKGSILAWLGHLNALRWFLESGLETALILEDDVDWDIRLRSMQIPLAANAVREQLPAPLVKQRFGMFRNDRNHYWGNHNDWDLLYLGHCGDYFDPIGRDGPEPGGRHSFNLTNMPHTVYRDPSLPAKSDLHPFTQKLFNLMGLPEQSRVLHRSKFPLCSFGYAVTRSAAQRLVVDLAPPRYKEKGPRAFDVALLHACNKGPRTSNHFASPDKIDGLRCWTLNSELFHHMPGKSQIDEIAQHSGQRPGVPPVDAAGHAQVLYRNETSNIDCGFWSGDFAFDEGDVQQLHYLQEKVGRQGQCLKENRQRPSNDSLQKLIE